MSSWVRPGRPDDLAPDALARADLRDLRRAARERMDALAFDYYRTGARDEVSLRENRRAFRELALVPRMLHGLHEAVLGTTLLGQPVDLPVLAAPSAGHLLAHPDGELGTVRGCAAAGTVMIVSTSSTITIERLTAEPGARCWFQLYPFRDRGYTRSLVERAVAAGAAAVVLTVDVTTAASTQRRPRGGYAWPSDLEVPHHGDQTEVELALDWPYVDWLVSLSPVPVVLKGILHPDDARPAPDHGVRGVYVSNHGGRTLDGAIPSIRALPAIAEVLSGTGVETYLDGGVRRGSDVLKALALGARAVAVGRPILWGLAAAGGAGVAHVLATIRRELEEDMLLSGVGDVRRVPRELVVTLRT